MSAVSQKPGSSIYIAAKAGIEGFVPAFRKELAEEDIKVGLIEPGFTGADFQYPEFPPEKQKELIGSAGDVARRGYRGRGTLHAHPAAPHRGLADPRRDAARTPLTI